MIATEERVLFLAGDLGDGGGVNRVIADLSWIFTEKLNLQVTILPTANNLPTYKIAPEAKILWPRGVGTRLSPSSWSQLLSETRTHDFVFGFWTQDNFVATLLSRLCGKKAICCEHTSYYHLAKHIQVLRRLVYPFAWRIAVLNEVEEAHYRSYLGIQKVALIPNPILFESKGKDKPLKRKNHILAIGHFIKRKNMLATIEAYAESGLDLLGWKLILIGRGPEEQAIDERILELGLKNVEIVSKTDEIGSYYNKAKLLVATPGIEVFSLVVAEAGLSGVIPLAFAADGPAYLLNEVPELLVSPGDTAALANKMKSLATESPSERLIKKIQDSIARKTSPDDVSKKWKSLLLECGCATL